MAIGSVQKADCVQLKRERMTGWVRGFPGNIVLIGQTLSERAGWLKNSISREVTSVRWVRREGKITINFPLPWVLQKGVRVSKRERELDQTIETRKKKWREKVKHFN